MKCGLPAGDFRNGQARQGHLIRKIDRAFLIAAAKDCAINVW
jgi:hypothetical protein